MRQQSATSCEYQRWRVRSTLDGAPYDPTGEPVAFALTATTAAPANVDWVDGAWETVAPFVTLACLLVGPGGATTPTAGTYYVWLRVTDNPEVPVRLIDTLVVT